MTHHHRIFFHAPLRTAQRMTALLAAFFLVFALGTAQQPAPKKPIGRDGLLKAVKINGLSTRELVREIETRGVSFVLGTEDEEAFRSAGARPEVIEAIKNNYRPPTGKTEPGNTDKTWNTDKPVANVPPGPPLSKQEVLTLLHGGVEPDRVIQFVEARGVSFQLNQAVAAEIRNAGGTPPLLKAIAERAVGKTGPPPPVDTGPDYDDYTDMAINALNGNDPNAAVQHLQRAVALRPGEPKAHALLGFTYLYHFTDPAMAEREMYRAIETGGAAAFRVYHDHDGVFANYCIGSLFISRDDVTFRADNGVHTFEAAKNTIKEARVNAFVGSEYGAFHLKVTIPGDKKSRNYNFAPATRKRYETDLVLNLVQGFAPLNFVK